ncbi:hypothetical protein [Paludisphaera mucosa]|uniref:DUF805 domain-containing protein n=1 Tax=Paludisphaera mucosa TaxID=3030827 RepID=A0ABT6F4P2_9BACT|nr:hypothetical protein [Paludisphaera mucosa]MDG3002489.1 hypothetical protein [Paludisphaera mucosa]
MSLLFAATTQPGLSQYYIGWGTLSLINAGLAQSKGHSGMAWWIMSLMLGPVATLIIVALLQPPSVLPGSPSIPLPEHSGKPPVDPATFDELA